VKKKNKVDMRLKVNLLPFFERKERVRVLRVLRKYCHDPDFARIPLAHQMACLIILYFKNNLYFAVNQLVKLQLIEQ